MPTAERLTLRIFAVGGFASTSVLLLNACENQGIPRPTVSPNEAPTPIIVREEKAPTDSVSAKRQFAARFANALGRRNLEEIGGFFARDVWNSNALFREKVRVLAWNVRACTASANDVFIRDENGREVVTVMFEKPCGEVFDQQIRRGFLIRGMRLQLDAVNQEIKIHGQPVELLASDIPIPTSTPTRRTSEVLGLAVPEKLFSLDIEKWRSSRLDLLDRSTVPRRGDPPRYILSGTGRYPQELSYLPWESGMNGFPGFSLHEGIFYRFPPFPNESIVSGEAWLLFGTYNYHQEDVQDLLLFSKGIAETVEEFDVEEASRKKEGKTPTPVQHTKEGITEIVVSGRSGPTQYFTITHPFFRNNTYHQIPFGGLWVGTTIVSFPEVDKTVFIGYGANLERRPNMEMVFRQILQRMEFTLRVA